LIQASTIATSERMTAATSSSGGQPVALVRPAHRWRPFALLALPCLLYLTPLVMGFAWSSVGPRSPNVTGFSAFVSRTADLPITVETWGTGVLSVPLHARLAEYVHLLELPLWNPYQGLGEPYAAQGDGSPYSPFAITRALLPYSLENYVTIVEYYLSAVALYLLLRDLGLSEGAAVVGGIGWILSGALSLHLARPEFGDQLVMLPVLLWAAARAMRRPSGARWAVFALVAGLNALAGHIQIAMVASVVLVAFVLVYAWQQSRGPRAWVRTSLLTLGVFIVGNGLAAFYLLPLAEALRITSNRNGLLLSFIDVPYANLIAFFFPVLFGQIFQTWLASPFPDNVDWNNLYAFAGTWPLILVVVGWVTLQADDARKRIWFSFFAVIGFVLLLRFVSFPPIAGLDLIPIFGRQSPKHSQGVAALCLIIAASFAVDRLRAQPGRHATGWIALVAVAAVSSVITLTREHGTPAEVDASGALLYIPVTLLIVTALLLVIWAARRWERLESTAIPMVVGGAVVAEMSLYIPLGNGSTWFLVARLVLFAAIVVGALLVALNWRAGGIGVLAGALVGYALLVALPETGVPSRVDADTPPPYMDWLNTSAGSQYRSFGIMPDFSSIGAIQDIGAVGPLAPPEFASFVDLISTKDYAGYYRGSSNLILTNGSPIFSLDQYARAKPIFDWFGVKYLVLDRSTFNPTGRTDDQTLLANDAGVQVAYDDGRMRVLESADARPKAEFFGGAHFASDQQSIIDALKADPQSILSAPSLEAADVPLQLVTLLRSTTSSRLPVDLVSYTPNSVQLRVTAPTAGLVVLKDSYFPGWEASLNGEPARVVRVDGIARGVILSQPGDYDVRFEYRPFSFVAGVWLSGLTALLVVAVLAWDVLSRRWVKG
jgi:hypothetical protein